MADRYQEYQDMLDQLVVMFQEGEHNQDLIDEFADLDQRTIDLCRQGKLELSKVTEMRERAFPHMMPLSVIDV